MTWKTDVRRWARERGATHAVIAGCGPEKRLAISGCIGRIDAAHCNTSGFTAMEIGAHNTAIVHDAARQTVAILHDPTRREPDGHDERGRQLWRHIDCGDPS